MYFFEHELAGEPGFESHDSYARRVDGAVGQTIARAIRDATQSTDPALRQEAVAWLWICCPDIAEQVDLPDPDIDAMPAHATSYVRWDANK